MPNLKVAAFSLIAAIALVAAPRAGAAQGAQGSFCWIDAASGKPVSPLYPLGFKPGLDDPKHFSFNGHNYVLVQRGGKEIWIDAASGKPVSPLYPLGFRPGIDNPKHFSFNGHNYAYVECPAAPADGPQVNQDTSRSTLGTTRDYYGKGERLQAPPIEAEFDQTRFLTRYSVLVSRNNPAPVSVTWTLELKCIDPRCTASPPPGYRGPAIDRTCSETATTDAVPAAFLWRHGDSNGCNHDLQGPSGHQGVVRANYSVRWDGRDYRCVAEFEGTNSETGRPPVCSFLDLQKHR